MSLYKEMLDPIDRMDRIATCWQAIADLITPDSDGLQERQRSNIGVLLDFLAEEYEDAREALYNASRANRTG